jgi:hypothetical protein
MRGDDIEQAPDSCNVGGEFSTSRRRNTVQQHLTPSIPFTGQHLSPQQCHEGDTHEGSPSKSRTHGSTIASIQHESRESVRGFVYRSLSDFLSISQNCVGRESIDRSAANSQRFDIETVGLARSSQFLPQASTFAGSIISISCEDTERALTSARHNPPKRTSSSTSPLTLPMILEGNHKTARHSEAPQLVHP